MKLENKQHFSIRKYAIGAASVLIGFAFQAQAVATDGVVPAPTENQPAVQTTGEVTPPTSEEKLETTPSTENVAQASPVAPVTNTEAPTKSEVTGEAKKSEPEQVENKKVATVEAPSANEYKLPETGSHHSAGLVVAGLMTTLAAYGLTKRKED